MGKFDSELAEKLYGLSLVSWQDDEIGSVSELGWYGLFEEERAILFEDDQGFVSVEVVTTEKGLQERWSFIQEMYSDYYGDDE